jgi:hypothetical protein
MMKDSYVGTTHILFAFLKLFSVSHRPHKATAARGGVSLLSKAICTSSSWFLILRNSVL